MIVVDSSVFVAFYNEADNQHKEAEAQMQKITKGEKILINDYIVNEVVTVLLKKVGLKKAKEVMEALLDTQEIALKHTGKEEFFQITEIFKKQAGGLSFVDCSIILLAQTSGGKIITFDKNLAGQMKLA